MKTGILGHQVIEILKDEWRLQWRNWGTWLVGIFFLAVVLSEHPVFAGFNFSVAKNAGYWADRASLVGSLVAMLTVPFALDRVRRQRVAPIEFSKPFEKLTYVAGKFMGAVFPLILVVVVSMIIHLVVTVATAQSVTVLTALGAYLNQMSIIAFPPLFYAASLTFCLSVYIRRPIIIIPLYLFYLTTTSLTQAAADANFSWLSPLVRPEYFGGMIPTELIPTVWLHQIIYLSLSAGFLVLAAYGFQRKRFLGTERSFVWWKRFRFPFIPGLGVKVRMLWGGHIVAALLMAFFAISNTLSNPETHPILLAKYALFGLEFYLPVTGLLILAGVIARDKGMGALDLVLTKPVKRWRLLGERLLPALAVYGIICMFAVALLRRIYPSLPILKALLVSLSTGIYLGLIGMTVADVTHNTLAGYGAGLIFWFFEAAFDGRFTAPFYLFIVSNQVHDAAGEVWQNPAIWLPVKVGLLVLAMWLFLLNGWLLDAGSTRRRVLIILVSSISVIFIFGWWLMPIFV